jgi:homoserine O-acetyltransferase/O-succinyltransferase
MSELLPLSPATRWLELAEPFEVEAGARLDGVRVAFRTWGRLDADGGNAVVVCHALTGSADVERWWPGLIGPGRALDPERDLIVASNVLGSCYGTTGPSSPRPGSVEPYGSGFPAVTVRDMVRLQQRLLDHLGVRRVRLVLGGSLGGMQALEWAALDPERVEAFAVLCASGRHSAWAIAISAAQRAAIASDPRYQGGRYDPADPPSAGLAAARSMAMITYRSPASFAERFGRARRADGSFEVVHYLEHQGAKLVERFDANSYVTLTHAMDTHDVARQRGEYDEVLQSIQQPALIVACDSDLLYPPEEQEELAAFLPQARLAWLRSPRGHDAFLLEEEAVNELLVSFRRRAELPLRLAQPCRGVR